MSRRPLTRDGAKSGPDRGPYQWVSTGDIDEDAAIVVSLLASLAEPIPDDDGPGAGIWLALVFTVAALAVVALWWIGTTRP